ncbi:hypothetical protein TEA_021867 [Camellia sinensis var. sinensis]|uniref:AB hydrolase-1 domain-containing protein n=1 Tax=Camellia sinensis var. sinensis TaxID=542762 RepID=A0A4S4EED8_CAMSN|nr:hypothetical protein TEA_021867 [Camellia sinensis var. sinensis]
MAKTMRKPELLMVSRFLKSPGQGLHRITYTRSLETLAFEEVRASPERPDNNFTAFVLHGLFDWRMVLVDLRNHGRSAEIEGLNPPHDMTNTAKDLADLIKSQGLAWPDVVLGHFMGGKVALQFAESCARGYYGESAQLPRQKPYAEQLWVLDSIPGKVNPENNDGEVEKVLQTSQSLPTSIPSRKWLMDHMSQLGFFKSLSHWIGSNLKKSGEHETWAFNLEGALQMFNSYRWLMDHMSQLGFFKSLSHWIGSNLKKSGEHETWAFNLEGDVDVIQRLEHLASWRSGASEGKVSVHVLPNSGHWVHVDNPKGLLEIVAPRIASIA